MANTKKIQDPREAALSAIQEALDMREEETEFSKGRPSAPDSAEPADTLPELRRRRNNGDGANDAGLFLETPARNGARGDDAAVSGRRAANDDRHSIGQILQAVQRRPSRVSYTVATIFAAAWLMAGFGLAWVYMPELETTLAQGAAVAPVLIGLGALFVLPMAFFYALAHMVWRAQELRLIAQSMAEVAVRLAEPETVARDSIVSVGQAIRREVAAMGDGVERALARAAELEALVHNEVSALERAYNDNEVRIRGLLHDLASQRDTLVNQAEQVRNAITSVHLDLSHDISAVSELVAEKVNETAQRITRTLADKGEHITLALGHAGDSMISALTDRSGELLERLEQTSDQTTHAISNASERLTASLNFKADHIHDEFAGLAADLRQKMSSQLSDVADDFEQRSGSMLDMMGGRTQEMADAIIDSSARIAETITSRVEEVNSTLKATGDSLVLDLSLRGGEVVANLEQTGARIADTLVNRSTDVTQAFRASAENLAHVIDAKGEAAKNMLSARLLAFEEMFTHGGTELGEKITRESTTLGNLITRHLSEFDRTVKTHGGELVERLGDRTEEVADAMRTYVDGFDSRVNARAEDVSGMLDQRLVRFQEALDSRTQALNDALNARVIDIATTLAEGGKEVVTALDKRIDDVTTTISDRGATLAETLVAKIADIDRSLGSHALDVANNLDGRIGRIEQLNAAIKTNADEAERTLTGLSSNVSTVLRQNADDVERTLLSVSAEVARNFVGKADEIAVTVGERAAEMTRVLDQSGSGLLASLTDKSQKFVAEVGRATDHALKEIDTRGFAFTNALVDSSHEIARGINEASVTATMTVTQTLQDLQETTQAAIDQSKQTAAATVSEMLETHGMLRSDTTALFERLREANILLQEVLSGAHENMSSLENTMVSRVSEFVSTMNELMQRSGSTGEKVEEYIGKFHTVTTRALGDLSQIAMQFEAHGRGLAEAVDLIDRSNRRTEDTLGERRVSLESLISTLDIRTDDLGQRLERFTGLLDDSLEAAAGRARDIVHTVSEASTSGARAITEQFETVRSTAEEERKRTAEAMQGIYEDARSDNDALFRQATERFTEVIQGMKHMAAEMQHELESTRRELRRGILELPQETAESAAQMRRVIVDQIEALAELNRIVARHGRGLDAAETNHRSGRDEGMLAGVGARIEPARPGPRIALSPHSETVSARAEAPSLSPAAGNGRGSWLTDLLQRASRDEGNAPPQTPRDTARGGDERTARHSIESLDSLSVDIARMIDHDAAAELWDKYKRGERNVFTRRLYTLQGQKAFDDIRKKYRSEREFKQTVDRYIAEFERLLDEVSRDDRGQVVARTYLTSETGKVYTMLAHAAGRFE
jgi:hypothetical protein